MLQSSEQANVRVSVFETLPRQTYEDNPRTWTMALHWSRRNVEQCLPPELFAALSSAHTNPWHEPSHDEAQSLPVVDGKTGEVLVAAKVDDGRRVVRRKLRDLFRRGIDVRFGYKLAGVDTSGEGVTATFENGEVVRVDVIVGADGGELRLAGLGECWLADVW
ncbi:hypothetical protein KNSL1_007080 [Colletotrichum chrysophilum]|nr:hypothetical protein KNSL1_007080 [Colletotrichum chrysophilum]